MGPSVLQQHDGSAGRGSPLGEVGRAWERVGRPGSVGVVLLLCGCVVATTWWLPATARALGCGAALLVLVAAALVDATEHRLPNRIVALALVPVVATLVVAWSVDVTVSTATGAAFVAVPLLATHLVSPLGMGFGDVKAGAVLGAAVGLVEAQIALLALVLALAGGALWGLTRRARSIPLGPALVTGALAALAAGRLVGLEAR